MSDYADILREQFKELRTDPVKLAAFILFHYGTPRQLSDLLDAIYKGMDDMIFNSGSQVALAHAADIIGEQAYCEEMIAARDARIAHMCDYEDKDNDD